MIILKGQLKQTHTYASFETAIKYYETDKT